MWKKASSENGFLLIHRGFRKIMHIPNRNSFSANAFETNLANSAIFVVQPLAFHLGEFLPKGQFQLGFAGDQQLYDLDPLEHQSVQPV
jgi:hypothetical protein